MNQRLNETLLLYNTVLHQVPGWWQDSSNCPCIQVCILMFYNSHGKWWQMSCLSVFVNDFFLRPWWCFFLIVVIVWGYDVRTIWKTGFLVSLSATFLLSLAWLITEDATLTASLNFIQTHNHNNAALDLVWCDVNFNILSKAKYALLILVCCQPWGALNMEKLDCENIEHFEEKS